MRKLFKSLFVLLGVSLAAFSVVCAAPLEAKPTTMPVYISDEKVNVQAYNIKDENYFKLRDIAKAFEGAELQFEVLHSQATNSIYISTGAKYTSVGGEMAPPQGTGVQVATDATAKLYINGILTKMNAYNVNWNNYYRAKDIGSKLGFSVQYDEKNNSVLLDCAPLVPEKPPAKPDEPNKPTVPDKPAEPELPQWPENPKERLIMIDAGHGGSDTGARNKEVGIAENTMNFDVAQSLANKLKAEGYNVVMIRKGRNETLGLSDRMEIVRKAVPYLVVSVHHNATENHNANGAEVLGQVDDKNGGNTKRLGELIGREFIKIGQVMRPMVFRYNSAKTGDYYGLLRAAKAVGSTAVISEFAFIDHPDDIAKINSPQKLELEADALFRAVSNYMTESN